MAYAQAGPVQHSQGDFCVGHSTTITSQPNYDEEPTGSLAAGFQPGYGNRVYKNSDQQGKNDDFGEDLLK